MNNTLIPLHPHTNLFVIEVPEDATDIEIEEIDGYNCFTYKSDGKIDGSYIPFNMNILGTVKNKVIDFDCPKIFNEKPLDSYGNTLYMDYKENKYKHWNAGDAFLSLMESNGLDLTKDYVILKKI